MAQEPITNSLGLQLNPLPPGELIMAIRGDALPAAVTTRAHLRHGDVDDRVGRQFGHREGLDRYGRVPQDRPGLGQALLAGAHGHQRGVQEDQEAGREAGEPAGKEESAMARKGLGAPDDSTIKEGEAKGVNLVRLTDADKQAFKKATKKVYDKWAKTIGPELVKKAEQAIAKRK